MTTSVKVRREPAIYRPDREWSFFGDLIAARHRDIDAMERLHRHEQRTNPNTTAGQGGEFSVPKWAIDQFATPSRAGRVLGDLVQQLLLPAGVSSVHVPRELVGSETAVDQEGGAVPSTDMTTADQSSSVVTIAGEADVSQQLYDQTPA